MNSISLCRGLTNSQVAVDNFNLCLTQSMDFARQGFFWLTYSMELAGLFWCIIGLLNGYHCYGGQSYFRAIGVFAVKMLGGDNFNYFETGTPNEYVYDVLETVWIQRMLCSD